MVSEDESGNRKKTLRVKYLAEVLVSPKSILKIFRDAYVKFYDWKILYK